MGLKVKNIRNTRTREAIFEALFELMEEKDFDKITIQNLTERAQINRATFYAHFQDKYELLDEIIKKSAGELIEQHTHGVYAFTKEHMMQLVFAAFEYHQQVKKKCRRNYHKIIPLLSSKLIVELKHYLNIAMQDMHADERILYVQIYANMINDAVTMHTAEQTSLTQQRVAEHITQLIQPH
ncbi:TetR/AcrR family transcriptional regulator [Paenibacillus nicotianae]|uniref:TetR/AcrR family transcriptional regulator n=1 Tax=Paenibacillus nicotianae TaxID=1526551 RepID=A0ABW4UQQ7_9BACL